MTDQTQLKPREPVASVEMITSFQPGDLEDLCDATDAAIEGGGGFGWLELPARDILERYWQGVLTMPTRLLFVARLDGVICGTCQLVKPPVQNEARKFAGHLTTHFVAPWAREYGLASKLLDKVEAVALEENLSVINLDVRETMTNAIAFYESKGYIRFGTHPVYAKVDGKVLQGHYYYKVIEK